MKPAISRSPVPAKRTANGFPLIERLVARGEARGAKRLISGFTLIELLVACQPKLRAQRERRPTRSAFTLIELLVVIAIIAMLFSLMLPALTRAKYMAGVTACKSNLKEVVSGLFLYAADHDGMYPKNGATRNSAYNLMSASGDGRRMHDIETVMNPYYGDNLEVFGCPLVAPLVKDNKVPYSSFRARNITYALLFDTRGTNDGSSIAASSTRVVQYYTNGDVIADASSSSQMRTWWWAKMDESRLMRRVGQTWTLGNGPRRFRVLACDKVMGRGHPVYGMQSNHPTPGALWEENGTQWLSKRTANNEMAATSGNFASTDGSVRAYQKPKLLYYVQSDPNSTGVSGVGIVPNFLEE